MPFTPILPTPLFTWLLFLGAILTLLAVSEWFSSRIGLQPENSRQLVHVIVGIFIFLCRFIFQDPFYPILTGIMFIGINLATLRMGQFKSMHATNRISYGTVYFPLAFVILAALFWYRDPVALQVAILLLAFADPLAAWVGYRYGRRVYILWQDSKTVEGSVAMFLGSGVLIFLGLTVLLPFSGGSPLPWPQLLAAVLLLAVLATVAEAQSFRGSDNASVPLAAAFFIFMFRSLPSQDLLPFLLWTVGSGALLALAVRLKALALSGFLTAWAMGVLIFLAGGWQWVLPIVAFFILSSLLTRLNPKASASANPGRSAGHRNLVQVFANGGIPLLVAAAYGILENDLLFPVFVAALAAATADTWGTEIGGWSAGQPRNIITGKKVGRGDSGGITLAGTIGTAVGAACLAGIGWWLQPQLFSLGNWLAITMIGFLAATIDSILGATVQVRFLIPATGKITEDRMKSGQEAVVHSGWWWLDNNMVNLMCTGSGAALGLLWILT